MDWNSTVIVVFAPLLIVTGIFGFIIPEDKSLTSGAPAYNLFHIAFGVIGLVVLVTGGSQPVRAFNIGFGLIDLYQAAASWGGLFPKRFFRWKKTDDVLHVVIGLGLVAVGMFAS